jgi:hypothetical protein
MTDPNTTGSINRILLRTAINAEPIVDRSANQKLVHISKLRAELHDLGYSIVTTEWLNAVFSEMPVENLERVAREAAK